ncbi:MAG: Crp/Fnr family transcriptional regulator [Peptococcaceae bacterium]|nr:Crp/Fnr family transcriptional regulator [Peptococcaceae bacterium]
MIKVDELSEENLLNDLFESGEPLEFDYGDTIYKKYEHSKGLYYFKQGKIRLCTIFPDGMGRTIEIIRTPCILGETSLIDGGTNLCTAIALAKTKVLFIPREKVLAILPSNSILMNMMMNSLAKKIRTMQLQVENASFKLPQRIARLLINNYDEIKKYSKKDDIRIIVTHDELAGFLGTTRPKITEHLNEFSRLGLIEKGRGYFRIKN